MRLFQGITYSAWAGNQSQLRDMKHIDDFLTSFSRSLGSDAATDTGPTPVLSDLPFVMIGNTNQLSKERALQTSSPITGTDGGANGSYAIGLDTSASAFDIFLHSQASDNYETGTLTFDSGTILSLASGSTVNVVSGATFNFDQTTGTAPFTVDSTTVVANLNADTVDGLDSTQFLRSDADDTGTGTYTFSNAAPAVYSSNDPVISIGDGAGNPTLKYSGTVLSTDLSVVYENATSGVNLSIDIGGSGTAFVSSGGVNISGTGAFLSSFTSTMSWNTSYTTSAPGDAGYAFNSNNTDTDFKIETTGSSSFFYVDSSANRLGIMTNTPSAALHVVGAARVQNDSLTLGLGSGGGDPTITFDGTTNDATIAFDEAVASGSPVFVLSRGVQALTVGNNTTTDPTITFDGATNDGTLVWDESADEFVYADTIAITDTTALSLDTASPTIEWSTSGGATSTLTFSCINSTTGFGIYTFTNQGGDSFSINVGTVTASFTTSGGIDMAFATSGVGDTMGFTADGDITLTSNNGGINIVADPADVILLDLGSSVTGYVLVSGGYSTNTKIMRWENDALATNLELFLPGATVIGANKLTYSNSSFAPGPLEFESTHGFQFNSAATYKFHFNPDSADVDFQVESNGDANCLFVDGGADKIGVGTAAPGARVDIQGRADEIQCLIDAYASAQTSSIVQVRDTADNQIFTVNNGGVVVNDSAQSKNFRVETGSDTDAIDLNGTANTLGLFEGTPANARVHITQSNVSAGIAPLNLQQDDVSEEMLYLTTTIGTGNAIEAVGAKSLTTTHFIKVSIDGVGFVYIPCGTIA